jgi:hypothetical protein
MAIEALVLAANACIKDPRGPAYRSIEKTHGFVLEWPADSAPYAFEVRAPGGAETLLSPRELVEKARPQAARFWLAPPLAGRREFSLSIRYGAVRLGYVSQDDSAPRSRLVLATLGDLDASIQDLDTARQRLRGAMDSALQLCRAKGDAHRAETLGIWLERVSQVEWVSNLQTAILQSMRTSGIQQEWQALYAVGERARALASELAHHGQVSAELWAAACLACCGAIHRSALPETIPRPDPWEGDVPFGLELAARAADLVDQRGSIARSHRDYCGTGLFRAQGGGYVLCAVQDGAPLDPALAHFPSREALVAWLSTQSDYSLGRLVLAPTDVFNQTLCRGDVLFPETSES